LRYAYIVRCTGVEHDATGRVATIHCTYDPTTRSGTPGAEARKVKGNIHWLSADDAVPAEVRLYDRLFRVPYPGARNPWGERGAEAAAAPAGHAVVVAGDDELDAEAAERDFIDDLNADSMRVITALVEPALARAEPEARYQFERAGYFVADRIDHAPGRAVFNRTVTLKDSCPAGRDSPSRAGRRAAARQDQRPHDAAHACAARGPRYTSGADFHAGVSS